MTGYWDPLPTARRLAKDDNFPCYTGRWEDRNWRNVPGPFYGAETDSLDIGWLDGPDHVTYDGEREFVYRQPTTQAQAMSSAAHCDYEEDGHGISSKRLLWASRLLRNRPAYEERFGADACEAMLTNALWGVCAMIGKLNPRVYVLSR
jgi:hypothetical protein